MSRRTHLRPDRQAAFRVSPHTLSALAGRLTERDRWIIRMLFEHRVLTNAQINQLAFGNDIAARHRMLTLYQLGVADRFRPYTPRGSAPLHYVLGPAGASVLAAEDGTTVTELGYRHDSALAVAHTTTLDHTVGVNGFFTALAATARVHPHARLLTWWSEQRCARHWGDLARPDAYGRWQQNHAEVDFFLEYDTGTETLDRVAAKLDGYSELVEATELATPVLFSLPTDRREANLRQLLNRRSETATVPVATGRHTDNPAEPVWLPAGVATSRRRLADLGNLWPAPPSQQAPAPQPPY